MSVDREQRAAGARIDTSKPISFFFDGKPYRGYHGDTLASALLANGVKIVGRSFKLHRPRGIFSAGKDEANALVQLEDGGFAEPNVRATLQPLYPGLRARGQNAWPSVRHDLLAVLGLFKPLLPASFYYKTMMWPSWHVYEWLIRRMAGLGKAPHERDAQTYHKRNTHCDLLIVGAGPAGLAAALQAAPSGQRILLIDEQEEPGGSLLAERERIDAAPALDWVANTLQALAAHANVEILSRTTVTGYYDHNVLAAVEHVGNHLGPAAPAQQPRERWWRIRAKQVVLATGAIERPLVFPDNDRPGIMLASAVRHYLNRYGVAAGRRAVIVTNNDSAYQTALDLAERGVAVVAIVDTRHGGAGEIAALVKKKGVAVHCGSTLVATHGRRGLRAVTMAGIDRATGAPGSTRMHFRCDLLAMSGGWSPTVHLFSQSGGALRYDDALQCFLPERAAQAVTVAGSAAGEFSLAATMASGADAAVAALGVGATEPAQLPKADSRATRPPQAYWLTPGLRIAQQWVDFQYDVTVADIALAARENFVSVEHLKRHTTAGMSIDQGKTSNVNALAILALETGRAIPEVGTTRFRPPYHPVTIGAIAGRAIGDRYSPRLEMPAHDCHEALGADFDDYGGWLRPACYPRDGESEEAAICREVLAVRRGVGLFDASPLGKIEVRGPDAAEFLNRVYVNNILSLRPGCARYGLMLNEMGIVIDDGVLVRIGEEHFLVHTTSSAAARIFLMLEEWLQCEWTALRVRCTQVTTQWATLTLSGQRARTVLAQLDTDIDWEAAAFSHMQFRSGHIMGVPARVLRASFTGEASYEISVPAGAGASLWELLRKPHGVTPYGLEALMVMRTEKGYLHVGADTDGTSNPLDLGWGPAIAKKQSDFIGRRSLSTPNALRADRFCFAGIEPLDPDTSLPIGAHVVDGTASGGRRSGGYVTSACYSPTFGRHIGLGIIRKGPARSGEIVSVMGNDSEMQARLRSPVYYDPAGERLRG